MVAAGCVVLTAVGIVTACTSVCGKERQPGERPKRAAWNEGGIGAFVPDRSAIGEARRCNWCGLDEAAAAARLLPLPSKCAA